jgi:hypothetical protein
VTSERRRAANRANAAKSTGPRTPAGKARARHNARRHGLTLPVAGDPAWAPRVQALAAAFAGGAPARAAAAASAAEAAAHLERIVALKTHVLQLAFAQACLEGGVEPAAVEAVAHCRAAPQLLTLSGYERKARSRLNRALGALRALGAADQAAAAGARSVRAKSAPT